MPGREVRQRLVFEIKVRLLNHGVLAMLGRNEAKQVGAARQEREQLPGSAASDPADVATDARPARGYPRQRRQVLRCQGALAAHQLSITAGRL